MEFATRLGEWVHRGANASWLDKLAPVSPLHVVSNIMRSRTEMDRALPHDHLGAVGQLAFGPIEYHKLGFARGLQRYGRNKSRARAAREQGAPLPAGTPDGDTWTSLLPNAPMAPFDEPDDVITNFDALTAVEKAQLIVFLKSL